MIIFETLDRLVSVGFNVSERRPDNRRIFWSSDDCLTWNATKDNSAGDALFRFDLDPEFVKVTASGFVLYQPGVCIEATYIGFPSVLVFTVLFPENRP